MPYPRAHWWVLFVIAVILTGFWQSYFSVVGEVPWQFHAHGFAASVWVILVFTQSWSAHHNSLALHRASGKASLFLFPFLIMGLAAIIDITGKGYVADEGPVRALFGASFLIGLLTAIAAYVTLYYRALKYRRKVWVHAGYLLGTPLILFESPFSRIMSAFIPGFIIRGPEDFDRILPSILWSDALALAFCLTVWLRVGKRGKPFLVTGGFVAVQMVTMGLLSDQPILWSGLRLVGNAPTSLVLAVGFAIGAVTSCLGWNAGKRPAIAMPATGVATA